jgi:hypothetical protein
LKMNQFNSEIILNVSRILVLLSRFHNQKTIKTTLDKIMLYDFYLKYPNIMIDDNEITKEFSFYDYYAYYHWKPDREEYQQYLRYLMAKKLIIRTISSNEFLYTITEDGLRIIDEMHSSYSRSLKLIADYVKKNITKLSDTKVENEIITRSHNLKLNHLK